MQISPEKTKLIAIPGQLTDDSVKNFYSAIEDFCRDSKGRLSLDCSGLKNVTSNHVGILWQARNLCEKAGIEILLVEVSRNLARVLEVLDISDLFSLDIVDDDETIGEFTRTFQMSRDRNFEMTFTASDKDIEEAMDRFLGFIENFSDSDKYLFEIRTIFYEIATNIRLHAGQSADNKIKFMAVPDPDRALVMRFIDSGPPFNPASQIHQFNPDNAIKKKQKRGFGLIMISRMTDGITYERKNGELNVLTLEKKWK